MTQTASTQPDLWLASAGVPQSFRTEWLGLLAVRAQWQQIPTQVSEAMLAHIRFAWWRELLEELRAGKVAKPHPLNDALKGWMQNPALAHYLFTLLDVVEQSVGDERTIAAGEASMQECALPFAAQLNRMGVEQAEAKATAERIAQGWAWLQMLREMPARLRDGGIPLPQEWLQAYGLPTEAEAYTDQQTIASLTATLQKFLNTDWFPGWKVQAAALKLEQRAAQRFVRMHARVPAFYLARAAANPEALLGSTLLEPSRVALPLRLLFT